MQPEQSISQKIIRNTIFNAIGQFWGILVAPFLTPYIIGHVGIERYGIWAIVAVLTGYFCLLDFCIKQLRCKENSDKVACIDREAGYYDNL